MNNTISSIQKRIRLLELRYERFDHKVPLREKTACSNEIIRLEQKLMQMSHGHVGLVGA